MTSVPVPPHPSPPELPELPDGVRPSIRRPAWPAWTSIAALIAAFAGAIVGGGIIGVIAALAGASLHDPPASVTVLSTLVQDGCLIASALLFARMVAPPRPWQFGLRVPSIGRSLGLAAGGYLAFVLFSYAWLAALGQSQTKDDITDQLGGSDGTIALIAVTAIVTVAAPLAEEFFFRGYFFGALRGKGLWPAALLTGLAFGSVHVFGSPVAFLVPLAFLGTILCLLRERTASLYPGIALHCVNNSLAMSSTEHWGWQVPVVLVGSLGAITLLVLLALRVWPAGGVGRRVDVFP